MENFLTIDVLRWAVLITRIFATNSEGRLKERYLTLAVKRECPGDSEKLNGLECRRHDLKISAQKKLQINSQLTLFSVFKLKILLDSVPVSLIDIVFGSKNSVYIYRTFILLVSYVFILHLLTY